MLKIFKKTKKTKDERGITLVIAITTMTLLLSVSLSISNIVLRQIRITNINNASKPAFFVADSGIECAFYFDTALIPTSIPNSVFNENFDSAIFGLPSTATIDPILKCGNGKVLGLTKTPLPGLPEETMLTTFDIDYGDETCARVSVTRTEVATKISSYGYNTGVTPTGCDLSDIKSQRLVERGLTIKY